ncbi:MULTISPECIES: sigma-54 interaction domain-containing protein [Desulfosediminicola]|uniref:sigma-54 interaction domain-containing protein n=1 Tax=Desulfosediminicola TaxID=2886823 RepID=UPI0010AD200D|nr:sigma 54-interacting transcriptional regulator [Desulfosediminicola ganghwensis]
MKWNTDTRYKLLLDINNAIATEKNSESLFQALSKELHKHFEHDRLAIILYDQENGSINYFAAADGVQPGGVVANNSRPLANGAIAKIAIRSGQPAVFDDLSQYKDLSSVGDLIKAGLTSTMVFPMIVRDKTIGTINFSYRQKPNYISELTELLKSVTQQIAIAVDNMLAYSSLEHKNKHLKEKNKYLLSNTQDYKADGFFYASDCMREVIELLDKVARTDETILLTGETGTGKDFLARLIHERSHRSNHLFVKTNCPGLTSSLFESELFGHSKGAFTGADNNRLGRFELANKGTIFLDEIGELPIAMQSKLLQVLQEKQFERVGESSSTPVDVRIIAATNVDLLENVQNGEFRQDLYYRLETVTIEVPPLRKRPEDIPLLITNINASESERMNRPAPIYTEQVLDTLSGYTWPGNIRELRNLVRRLIILHPGERIGSDEIEKTFSLKATTQEKPDNFQTLQQAERDHIIDALSSCKGIIGGKKGAAHLLGIPRSTLQYRIKKLGINPAEI